MIGILGGMGTQAGLDFCNKLAKLNKGKTLFDVAKAARAGADATKKMPIAKAGRAAYLSRGVLQNVTDPGAEAVACLFEGLAGDASG